MRESSNSLPARLQESLIDSSSDNGLKMAIFFKFSCEVEKECSELRKRGLIELLFFGSTYRSGVTFSALTHRGTDLGVENSLVTNFHTCPRTISAYERQASSH